MYDAQCTPMRLALAFFLLAVGAGCGQVTTVPCLAIVDECSCYERGDCSMVTEACWCPSMCGSKVACVCGGGKFLRCEARPTR